MRGVEQVLDDEFIYARGKVLDDEVGRSAHRSGSRGRSPATCSGHEIAHDDRVRRPVNGGLGMSSYRVIGTLVFVLLLYCMCLFSWFLALKGDGAGHIFVAYISIGGQAFIRNVNLCESLYICLLGF